MSHRLRLARLILSHAFAARAVEFVALITNREDSVASKACFGHGLVESGQIEVSDLLVLVMDLRALDPEGGIARGFGVDANHGEIVSVDPDRPSIEELIVAPGLDIHYVQVATSRHFATPQGKLIVVGSQRNGVAIGIVTRRLLFRFDQAMQDMVED